MKKEKLIELLQQFLKSSITVPLYSTKSHILIFSKQTPPEYHSITNLFRECLEHLEGEIPKSSPLNAISGMCIICGSRCCGHSSDYRVR